jgi:hypothetical protein
MIAQIYDQQDRAGQLIMNAEETKRYTACGIKLYFRLIDITRE